MGATLPAESGFPAIFNFGKPDSRKNNLVPAKIPAKNFFPEKIISFLHDALPLDNHINYAD